MFGPKWKYPHVEAAVGALRADAGRFISGRPGGDFWGSDFLPEALRHSALKAFVRGMAEVVAVIGALLAWRRVPTVAEVTGVLSPFTGLPAKALGLSVNRHTVSHFFSCDGCFCV